MLLPELSSPCAAAYCCMSYMCAKLLVLHPIEPATYLHPPMSYNFRFVYVVMCINNYSFLLLGSIPIYGHTTVCLSIYRLMYIWVVHMLELVGIKYAMNILLQAFCGHINFIPLGKIPENVIGYLRIGIDLAIKEIVRLFSKAVTPLHSNKWEFWLSYILCHTVSLVFLILAILVNGKQ